MPVAELELSRAANAAVSAVFMDPSAAHVIACVTNDVVAENHYVHSRWRKSRLLAKLKGVAVTAVGWNGWEVSEHGTGSTLIGTGQGALMELHVDEREKKERAFKHLYSVGEGREPISGVCMELNPERMVVIVATPTRFFVFVGRSSLEETFAAYASRKAHMPPVIELPGDPGCASEVHVAQSEGKFAWLAQPGVYRGELAQPSLSQGWTEADFVAKHELLPFPAEGRGGEWPLSLGVTRYHFLLLYRTKLVAINQVSKEVVQEVPLSGAAARGLVGSPLGLTEDVASETWFMFTTEALHEISIRKEDRDMWRIFLAKADYEKAVSHCFTREQREKVHTQQAEAAFAAKDYMEAARLFARLDVPQPTFEQVALRFVEVGDPAALHEFLRQKLEAFASEDRAQATMVATWLTELQLDRINRALLEDAGEGDPKCQELVDQLRDFLSEYKDVLDSATTSNLLASYGRLDELMHLAALLDDNETVIEHLMQRGEIIRALGVLRKPTIPRELIYKFAPALLEAAPGETVDAWIQAGSKLDPRRLMPALVRCDEPAARGECLAQALRYVEFAIHELGCDDSALHNLAVSLYSSQGDEAELISYLSRAKGPLGRPLYDQKFALRLARERNRERACVQLLSDMGMFQDATALALRVDVELAKEVAERPEDDPPMRRKLWLAVARHVIDAGEEGGDSQAARIRQAVAFLKETSGLLKIEDILPFFPDFVRIDEFKDAICSSLEEYNRQIDHLRDEMDSATEIADVLRKDLAAVEKSCAVVDVNMPCERCRRPLSKGPPPSAGPSGGCLSPFYVFPCRSVFHSTCLAEEVSELVGESKRLRIRQLMERLAATPTGAETAAANNGLAPRDAVVSVLQQLEDLIAAECPRCGEVVIRLLEKPLIQDGEEEIASWAVAG